MMKRILVCDNDLGFQRLVSGHFGGLGCDVTVASDSGQAESSLKCGDYDLVILDLFIAKTDGKRFLSSLESGGAKLAMVAAEDDGDQVRYGRTIGADYYLSKPLQGSDLARLVTLL